MADVTTKLPVEEQIARSRPSDKSAQRGAAEVQKRGWGLTPEVFVNTDIRSSLPVVVLMAITVGFNKSEYAKTFYDWLNANFTPFQINCYGTFLITTTVYWIYASLYMVMDLTERPRAMYKYKIQPFHKITAKQYRQIARVVIRNQLLVSLPVSALFAMISWMGDTSYEGLPGFRWTFFTYCFSLCTEELGFFYVHRALHQPGRYKKYHKMHHTFTAPVAMAATYCTLVEHILSNLAPIILGHIILGSHWSMVVFFFCSLTMGTLDTHSGYNIPGLNNALRHDWHHFSFNENFGPIGILDNINGSSVKFKKALEAALVVKKGDKQAARNHLAQQMAQAAFDEPED